MIKLLVDIFQVNNDDLEVTSKSFNKVVSFDDLFLELTNLLLEINVFYDNRIVLLLHAIQYLSELFNR